jgi:glycosyltransferase involved in cell wall biosynthesis
MLSGRGVNGNRRGIVFLIRSLGRGGAERQLVVLAQQLAARGETVTVVTFYSGGDFEAVLLESGIRVLCLEKRNRWDLLGVPWKIRNAVRTVDADVIHSYLTDANVLAAAAKPLLSAVKLIWGVRASDMRWQLYDWRARASFAVSRLLSRAADAIVFNSQAGYDYHCSVGYRARRMIVVPNGFDTAIFKPCALERDRLRREWGIPNSRRLVGLVARLDPAKGHRSFLEAATMVLQRHENVSFAIVGGGESEAARELVALSGRLGLGDSIIWVGERRDMNAVYNALDLMVLASESEGFPNVVGEAMASGLPCVVTPSGDSALLVGDCGKVASGTDPAALAEAIGEMLALDGGHFDLLRRNARKRISELFSVQRLASRMELLLREIRSL